MSTTSIRNGLRHNSFSSSAPASQANSFGRSSMRHHRLGDDLIGDSLSSPESMSAVDRPAADANAPATDNSSSGGQFYHHTFVGANDGGVDELVNTLTQKLRLKSKSCHSLCRQKRMSPYQVHNNSAVNNHHFHHLSNPCYCINCKYFNSANNVNKQKTNLNDPYELMQELLKEGSLIKEAVKRLQLGQKTKMKSEFNYDYSDEETSGNENDIKLLNS